MRCVPAVLMILALVTVVIWLTASIAAGSTSGVVAQPGVADAANALIPAPRFPTRLSSTMCVTPTAPADLAIAGGTGNTYTRLTWSGVAEAANYQVWQNAVPDFAPADEPLVTVTAPVYLDMSSDPNLPVNRYYGVTATDACSNTSGLSNRVGVFYFPLSVSKGEPPPTSYELIDQALANGQIDAETALVYKIFVDFGDDRLPTQYRGDDSSVIDGHTLSEAQEQFSGLSPETQAVLAPFLLPPVYEGSWWHLQRTSGSTIKHEVGQKPSLRPAAAPPLCDGDPDIVNWQYKDATRANVRVWWEKSKPNYAINADDVIGAMDGTIWWELTRLMGREPLSDANTGCSAGSGRLDIYLLPISRSQAPSHSKPGCKNTPAYINLNPSASVSVLAHEFMHVIQWSYDVHVGCVWGGTNEYNWLMEATAQWAMDYVYPSINEEQLVANWFLSVPRVPLETRNDRHVYGAYLFPFYLTHELSNPGIVRAMWDMTTSFDSLDAVDMAIPDGFWMRWPEFTRYNWNRAPLDFYQQWDQLTQRVPVERDSSVSLKGAPDASYYVMSEAIDHLSARYVRYRFPDDQARNVIFRNGLAWELKRTADGGDFIYDSADSDGLGITALVKIAGRDWDIQDWTNKIDTYHCRDLSAERLEELVLIFSNSEWSPRDYTIAPKGLPPLLNVSNLGCAGWEGEVNYTNTASGEGWSYTTQSTTQVSWRLDSAGTSGGHRFYHSDGTLQWSVSGTDGFGCQLEGGGEIPIEWYLGSLWTDNELVGGPEYRRYHASGFWVSGAEVTRTCPDSVSTVAWDWQWLLEGEEGSIQSDGITIDGATHRGDGDPGGPEDWTWRFTAVRGS